LEFNVPFQHKYGYIRKERSGVGSYPTTVNFYCKSVEGIQPTSQKSIRIYKKMQDIKSMF